MTPAATEFNFDGLVGPTHNYAGLAHGNLASQHNRHLVSNPRQAALQGLEKMKFLADLGIPQVVLPPQRRPDLAALRRLGFTGPDALVIERAARDAPQLLAACYSASSMWAANAATVSPAADTEDGKLHLTPANLASHLHRSLETPATAAALRVILSGPSFSHHAALPAALQTSDEGAANHLRLAAGQGLPGIEIFVHGTPSAAESTSTRFAPRQSRTASESIARLHQLSPDRTLFVQQNPAAIDAGVFHNDVIAVSHCDVLLHHQHAFADSDRFIGSLRQMYQRVAGGDPHIISVPESVLPLADAVNSYLFNSQLVTLQDGTLAFLAPAECAQIPAACAALDLLRQELPGIAIHFLSVHELMRNGGGPACLRLRVVLTPEQERALLPAVRLTPALCQQLHAWIQKHYRESLAPRDLADPQLLVQSRAALDELAALGFPTLV